MKKPDRKHQINIRVSKKELDSIQRIAFERGESMAAMLRRLVWQEAKRGEK